MTTLAALGRARAAWEATQPQLTLTGWADMLDGLDEPHRHQRAVRFVEPAGLTHGGRTTPRALLADGDQLCGPAPLPLGGSAPHQSDRPGALHPWGALRARGGKRR